MAITRAARKLALAASMALCGLAIAAEEQAKPQAPAATPAAEKAVVPAPAAPVTTEAALRYWKLKGGGEVVGRAVKRTPAELFIDVGPRIISLPIDGVAGEESLEKAAELSAAPQLGRAQGVFDAETGALVFRASGTGSGEMLSTQEIVDRAKRSVVLISNPRGAGSGFVLDAEGRIVTNHHVVRQEKYHTVNVFKKSGDKWERLKFENVPVLAYSDLYDIAVIQLDMGEVRAKGVDLQPMPIAAPNSLQVGDTVYAIGNPGAVGQLLEHSVTEGIASSLARNIGDVLYIQTTAAVNPGNSGGPLINARGEVVGLITLKAFMQEGIGFALPVDLIDHFLANSESYAYSEQAQNKGFRYLPPE